MQASFQPKRLQQARHLSRLSLADLGVQVDVTRQSLSQFENGDRTPAPDTLAKLSMTLNVPTSFLLRPIGAIESQSRTVVHYRTLRRTRDLLRERQRASALLDLAAALLDVFQDYVDFQPSSLPNVSVPADVRTLDLEGVEGVADRTRKALGLGEGPLSDITLLVENQSAFVVYMPLPDGMDGVSAWYGDRPIIGVSNHATYVRTRLNVAHEYGHLILHQALDVEELDDDTFDLVERQAWRFAGAFMLPAKSFLSEVYNVSLDALVMLKSKWGVSIAAMIRRLSDLSVISDAQVRHLNIQLRQRGWHKVEPGDEVPNEVTRLLARAATFVQESGGPKLPELAASARLPLDFIADALSVERAALLPSSPKNVVQFRLKSE